MTKLRCTECGREVPPDAPAWKAEIADDPEDDEQAEVVMYCPKCWQREFSFKLGK